MQPHECKWWTSFAVDVLTYVSFLLCYLSLPLPHVTVISKSTDTTIYGWTDSHIWGWTFPHAIFFFVFLVFRRSNDVYLRLFIFYELLFGLSSATIGPTTAARAAVDGSKALTESTTVYRVGTYALLSAYLFGAAAAFLQLILVVRDADAHGSGESGPTAYQVPEKASHTSGRVIRRPHNI